MNAIKQRLRDLAEKRKKKLDFETAEGRKHVKFIEMIEQFVSDSNHELMNSKFSILTTYVDNPPGAQWLMIVYNDYPHPNVILASWIVDTEGRIPAPTDSRDDVENAVLKGLDKIIHEH